MSIALTIPPPTCTRCLACGSGPVRPMRALRFDSYPGPFQLWSCGGCGVTFNWPQLPADALRQQYDADYYVFTQPPARRWARAAQLYAEHLYPLEHMSGRRLLEVGCGNGDLLALAARRGWDVHGIEVSPEPARRASAEHGLPIAVGTLEERGPELGRFDVAISTDVIEHVPSPRGFLIGLNAALRPGGLAIVETPNFGGFWRRIGGARWIGYNRFHVFLFGPANLLKLMQSCGFVDCRASSSTHTAYTHWGDRPELRGILNLLPPGLRWRTQRGLNRLTPAGPQTRLWREPPASIDEALRWIETTGRTLRSPRRVSLTGDNLCVTGQA